MSSRRRTAYTLAEMLATISLVAMAVAWIAIVLQGLFRVERSSRDALAVSLSVARLDDQFRRDVHQATTATVEEQDAANELVLSFSDRSTVRYRSLPGRVERTTTPQGARESFRLEGSEQARFSVNPAEPATVAIDWDRREAGPAVMRLESVLGLSRPATQFGEASSP